MNAFSITILRLAAIFCLRSELEFLAIDAKDAAGTGSLQQQDALQHTLPNEFALRALRALRAL